MEVEETEPYTLAQFMPAVVVGITATVGKHAMLCASREQRTVARPRTEGSLAKMAVKQHSLSCRLRQKVASGVFVRGKF